MQQRIKVDVGFGVVLGRLEVIGLVTAYEEVRLVLGHVCWHGRILQILDNVTRFADTCPRDYMEELEWNR